jgi:hypothetical protein
MKDTNIYGPGDDDYGRNKLIPGHSEVVKNMVENMKLWTGIIKSNNKMETTIGRIVHFNVPEDMKPKVNWAEKLPAIIVRVWSNDCVNLKIITDGIEDIWQTSIPKGSDVNQWEWPEIKLPIASTE